MSSSRWINRWITLDGVANMRDVGGLATADGERTQEDRLIRSDNLQSLTPTDVRVLVDEHRVRAVADLRTGVEVAAEGPGPMTREPDVAVVHLSLFPEAGRHTDVAALDDADGHPPSAAGSPPVLPWQERRAQRGGRDGAAQVYLGYLDDRADSAIAALRLIARTDGATIVHCAAGKDRTGVITALALAEVGVTREAIVADYALSAERIEQIFDRLRSSSTYAADLDGQSVDAHRPQAQTMARLLDALDEQHGGAGTWLRSHGWTSADAEALREHLLG